jgi:Protein of unknown function (DUF664)
MATSTGVRGMAALGLSVEGASSHRQAGLPSSCGGGNDWGRDEAAAPRRQVSRAGHEEYARHNGHADLLRERIDGRVGQ